MTADVTPPVPIPGPRAALSAVTSAIQRAAKATGASFDYLLATAKVESDLNPNLSMRSSSATGLFQFIEQTWLEVMKQAGGKLGFGRYADAITETRSGRYEVADPAMRAEIMKLRKDPAANAALGGVFTQQNAAILQQRIGRKPTDGELYIAHFFGPYSAAKVIRTAAANPNAEAAAMFPAAARANRPIFYDRQGNARSVVGVYQELVRRYQVARASPTPELRGTVAAAAPAPPTTPARWSVPSPQVLPEVAEEGGAVPVAAVSRPQAPAVASAQSPQQPPARPRRTDDSGSLFLALFQTEERRGALAPTVTELWGRSNARLRGSTVEGSATAFASEAGRSGNVSLALFQDMPASVRGLFEGKK
jgi:hypothetical protein